jgi:hypothetical protein
MSSDIWQKTPSSRSRWGEQWNERWPRRPLAGSMPDEETTSGEAFFREQVVTSKLKPHAINGGWRESHDWGLVCSENPSVRSSQWEYITFCRHFTGCCQAHKYIPTPGGIFAHMDVLEFMSELPELANGRVRWNRPDCRPKPSYRKDHHILPSRSYPCLSASEIACLSSTHVLHWSF